MSETHETKLIPETQWYAIRTKQDFKAEKILLPLCDEVFFPKETVRTPDSRNRVKAVIPHVLFIRTNRANALELERQSRDCLELPVSFWIYRYPTDNEIQPIPQKSIDLLHMLTADSPEGCRIFNRTDFREKERVRVVGGIYEGYQGFVYRVKKNKHVIVRIEGVCMVMLPFIHPDLLEKIDD